MDCINVVWRFNSANVVAATNTNETMTSSSEFPREDLSMTNLDWLLLFRCQRGYQKLTARTRTHRAH